MLTLLLTAVRFRVVSRYVEVLCYRTLLLGSRYSLNLCNLPAAVFYLEEKALMNYWVAILVITIIVVSVIDSVRLPIRFIMTQSWNLLVKILCNYSTTYLKPGSVL